MLPDLHTHTTASDGTLTPYALVERARVRGVTHLAITDHDTIDAYSDALPGDGPVLIRGIELSTYWEKTGIHVVGLNIDLDNAELRAGIRQQQAARHERAATIAKRLARKLGIDDPLPAVTALAAGGGIGRPHFAQHLVDIGQVRDRRQAFRKFLGTGKAGDVRRLWAPLPGIVHWITAAGGIAVLAHPAHYGLTRARLQGLLQEFRDCGGRAMEVVSGRQETSVTHKLAELAGDFGLLASCGSDFHGPNAGGSEPGAYPPLPATCRPVWDGWQ